MNISKQVIEILNDLSQKVGITIDWTQSNVMPQIQDFINRYAQYKVQSTVLWITINFILLFIGIFLVYKGFKVKYKNKLGIHEIYYMLGVLIIIIAIVSIIYDIDILIRLKTIPEVFFIELIQTYL